MVDVYDLCTGEIAACYSCLPPEDAVIAAYAQSLKDWNTWTYRGVYGRLVQRGRRYVTCGDFTARRRIPRKRRRLSRKER